MPYHLLLDTSTLLYRAFFALPASIADARGQPVNAVHGYLDMVAYMLKDLRPDQIVHVYDHDWRPAGRVQAYAGYKANRPPDPEGLPAQFDILREVLNATDMPQAEAPGWEADDALGVLCARAESGTRLDIVTGDRDLLQLVRDDVPIRVLFTTRGVSELTPFDEAAVLAKYGVPARRYVDFAILRGDPSDGLPGVKGVGEKTAQALVARYPTLDALLADTAAQTPRIAASLKASRDYLEAMRTVVPVRSDVDVRSWAGRWDDLKLAEIGERFRLSGAIRRVRAALDGTALSSTATDGGTTPSGGQADKQPSPPK